MSAASGYRIFASRVPGQCGPRRPDIAVGLVAEARPLPRLVARIEPVVAEARLPVEMPVIQGTAAETEYPAVAREPIPLPVRDAALARDPAVSQVSPTPEVPRCVAHDEMLIAILDQAPDFGEPLQEAFRRKEQALVAAFMELSSIAAQELQRRLTAARSDDVLATKFGRLAAERRARLLSRLAEAGKRCGARRGAGHV